MNGFVGLSQRRKQKLEAVGSSGAVQALRPGSDALAVGLDAAIANFNLVRCRVLPGISEPRLVPGFVFAALKGHQRARALRE